MTRKKLTATGISLAAALMALSLAPSQLVYATETKTAVETTENQNSPAEEPADFTGHYYGNFNDVMEYEMDVRSQEGNVLVVDISWYNMRVGLAIETTTIELDENNSSTFTAAVNGGHGADGSAFEYTLTFGENSAVLINNGDEIDFTRLYPLSPEKEQLWDFYGNYESEEGVLYKVEVYSSPENFTMGVVYEDGIADNAHATEYSMTSLPNVFRLNTEDGTQRYMIIYTEGDDYFCDWYVDGELEYSTVRVETWEHS